MNIFNVLGVRYEVFHSRMLKWLWSPQADHGGGDRFWRPIREMLGIQSDAAFSIDDEVKLVAAQNNRWRLADLLIRTGEWLILVENKVDAAYQDILQVQDELAGGKAIADVEARRFVFVLIAPGPLNATMQTSISTAGGIFIPWNNLLKQIDPYQWMGSTRTSQP